MVLSPPFKGLTRLRLRAGDARADRLAAGKAKKRKTEKNELDSALAAIQGAHPLTTIGENITYYMCVYI